MAFALLLRPRAETVSLEIPAARIPIVLDQIKAKTGLKLACDAAFTNEVLVVSATDVPRGVLLDKIARVSTGVWITKDGTLTLKPDLVRRGEQEKQRIAKRTQQIQAVLSRCAKELETPYRGEPPKEFASGLKSYAANRNTPIARLAMRMLISIGAPRLALVERGAREVFATNPNRLQSSLPSSGQGAVEEFRKEWRIAEKSSGTSTAPFQNSTLLGGWVQSTSGSVSPDSRFERVWISVGEITQYGSGSTHVGLMDANSNGVGGEVNLYAPPDSVPPNPHTDKTPLRILPEAVALGRLWSNILNPGHETIRADSAVGKLLLTHGFEPLSLCSEPLLQYAKLRKRNLIYLLNDNALAYLTPASPEMTVGSLETQFDYIADREEDDGWLLLTPSQPVDARRGRDDRKMVEQMVREASMGHLTLATECEYIAKRPYASAYGLGLRLASLFDTEAVGISYYDAGVEMGKRLYGLMTKTERGGMIGPYRDLTPAVKDALTRAVYVAGILNQKLSPPQQRVVRADYVQTRSQSEEVTYLLPDGIPAESVFTLRTDPPSMEVRRSSPAGNFFASGETLATVASLIFFKQNPSLVEGDTSNYFAANLIQPLRATKINMLLDLGSRWTGFAIQERIALDKPVVFEQLPADYKKALQAQVNEMNKQRDAGHPPRLIIHSGGPQTQPPP